MRLKHTATLFILASFLFITSCLTGNDQEDIPSQFAIHLQLEDIGITQAMGEDTLQITGIGFLQGPIALRSSATDSTLLYPGTEAFIPQAPVSPLLTGNLAPGTYQGMIYHIEKAGADSANIPPEFIDGEADDQRYSMIIAGMFNGSEFTYKSAQPFNYDYSLSSPVEVPEYNTSVSFGINFDMHQVFLNADSTGLLDPSDPGNAEQINNNIEAAIELLPFN